MSKGILKQTLDDLAPAQEDLPAWEDVLDRAGVEVAQRARRPLWKRSWIVLTAVLIAVLVPLAAIGSEENWWFLREEGMGPKPATDVVVVKSGTWNGYDWELVAYVSSTGGICYGIQPTRLGKPTAGGNLSCGPSTISGSEAALGWGKGEQLTPYVIGAVSEKAEQVEIYFTGGQVVRTPTIAAPKALGSRVRFYATPFPSGVDFPGKSLSDPVEKFIGLDGEGKIVACLADTGKSIETSLSACE
jgi:hypothetical protein